MAGLTVVEVASWLAAPGAAALMRDLGAEVIKVEPPGGDAFRHLLPTLLGDALPVNWAFELDNRGKRSVTVSLEAPGGSDVVLRLARKADIFITNLTSPRLRRYGLTAEAVRAVNPTVIYVALTGYGTHGPDAGQAGFDHTAFWARSGIMSLIGPPGAPPTTGRGGQGDHPTSLNILAATLAALRLRDQTGQGQDVEVTLQRTGVWTIGFDIAGALVTHQQPARADRVAPGNPLHNAYETSDGRWILWSMATVDRYWPAVCDALGRPEWLTQPPFDTMVHRRDNAAEVTAAIAERVKAHDLAYWTAVCNEHSLIWAPVVELPEVVQDPQLREMDAFTTVRRPDGTEFETLNAPFQIAGADIAVRGAAPDPGEHTLQVLEEFGFTTDEIADLAARGVFG